MVRARGGQVDVRGVFRRCLVEASEQCGFGQIDVSNRLAEIELRCRLDAKRTAAHVGTIKIELENFALGEAAFEQDGKECFLDLSGHRAFGRQEEVLCELLGQGRAALYDFVGAQVFHERAQRAENVDAEVFEKAAVLGGKSRLDDIVGDLFQRDGIVVEDAALAYLVVIAVEEFDRVAAG